jgi:hypothetical protein
MFTAIIRHHQALGTPLSAVTLSRIRATLRAAMNAAARRPSRSTFTAGNADRAPEDSPGLSSPPQTVRQAVLPSAVCRVIDGCLAAITMLDRSGIVTWPMPGRSRIARPSG